MRIIKPLLTLAVMVAAVYGLYTYLLFPLFFHYVKVIHVIDGDTLLVKDGQKVMQVQLIGVDAPEQTGPSHFHQCFDQQATHYVATTLIDPNNQIRLVQDTSYMDQDSGGRTLRYAYLKNGSFMNEKILQDGMARQYIDPDKKYQKQDQLAQVQKQAQSKNLGIWDPQGCNGQF